MSIYACAIMPIKPGHERFFNGSCDCFHSQTYKFRILSPWRHRAWSLGSLRNRMVESAEESEIIVHWDVDDWSAPTRIARQVELLVSTGAQVIGQRSMLFYDERTFEAWRFTGDQSANLGTSLCYRREWALANPFPDVNAGEDLAFIKRAISQGVYQCVEDEGLIVARSHYLNTCARQYGSDCGSWQRAQFDELPEGFRRTLEVTA